MGRQEAEQVRHPLDMFEVLQREATVPLSTRIPASVDAALQKAIITRKLKGQRVTKEAVVTLALVRLLGGQHV